MDRLPQKRKGNWISLLLQSRYWEQGIKNWYRNRWGMPQNEKKYIIRSEKNKQITRTRVENIEIYKQGSNDGSFSSIIEDRERNQEYVEFYDLEIENEHNYFAEKVLVHNCHHLSGEDTVYFKTLITMTAPMRIGVTATLPTKKESLLVMEGLLGEILGETTLSEGIEKDFLSIPSVKLIKVGYNNDVKDLYKYNDIYDIVITNSRNRNRIIINEIKKLNEQGKSTLTFVTKIEHGDNLMAVAENSCLPITFVQGSTEGDIREYLRNLLHEKKIMNILATTVFTEGVNIPSIDCIILAGGGKSELRLLQTIGRGLRRTKDKQKVLIIDFVDSAKYISEHFCERLNVYLEKGWDLTNVD